MEEQLNKIKKTGKRYRKFISFIFYFMLSLIILSVIDIIDLSKKSSDMFEVKSNETGAYYLYIDGNKWSNIDYNEYMASVDSHGNTNFKLCILINKVKLLITYIFMAIIIHFVFLMLDNIFEPFSMKNIKRLRLIALLTFLMPLVSAAVTALIKLNVFQNPTLNFSKINFMICLLGVIIGVISEVFKFGYDLQDEINQYA